MIIKEWSCFPNESDFLGMHAWRRWEKRDGFDHISDLKLSKASLICPLEQRLLNCSAAESPSLDTTLEVFVDRKREVGMRIVLNTELQDLSPYIWLASCIQNMQGLELYQGGAVAGSSFFFFTRS